MKIKNIKKIILCLISSAAVCAAAVTAAGCNAETAHPEVCITYEFNGKEYAVNYRLYRNMYPHTVKHFIELAENNFYDNLVIHDYKTNDWFTGAYTYDAESYAANVGNAGQMVEYFEAQSKEDVYVQLFKAGKFTSSVYSQLRYDKNGNEYVDEADALPTVLGEYKNNIQQEIEKGALTADYGCLKMYHYEKESTQKLYVKPTSDQIILADYKTNCATSLFALQTGSSSSYSAANYAVFAQLNGTETFNDFVEDVKDYISEYHGGTASDFYTVLSESVRVDNFDEFSNKPDSDKGTAVSFNVPKKPIVIKTVKVTKY